MSSDDSQQLPLYQLPIPDSNWSIVFTSRGSHYYHNVQSKISKWVLDDDNENELAARNKVRSLDKDMLLLITAKARGLSLDTFINSGGAGLKMGHDLKIKKEEQQDEEQETETISDETQNALNYLLGNSQPAIASSEVTPVEIEQVENEEISQPLKKVKTAALVGGYSSSEEEEEKDSDAEDNVEAEIIPAIPEPLKDSPNLLESLSASLNVENTIEGEHQKEHPQETDETIESSSEEENGVDINDIMSSSGEESEGEEEELEEEEVDHSISVLSSHNGFLQLLQETSNLDPYQPWEMESHKVINDPRFFEIDDNSTRKVMFNEWCRVKIAEVNRVQAQKSQLKIRGIENEEEGEEEEDETIKYYQFLHSKKSEGALGSFFKQFKSANSEQLDSFGLAPKEIETKYKEFLMYSKKSESDLIKLFQMFIKSTKIFKKNVLQNKDSLELDAWKEQSKDCEEQAAMKLLKTVEAEIELSDTIRLNTKYQILSPVVRLRQILVGIGDFL